MMLTAGKFKASAAALSLLCFTLSFCLIYWAHHASQIDDAESFIRDWAAAEVANSIRPEWLELEKSSAIEDVAQQLRKTTVAWQTRNPDVPAWVAEIDLTQLGSRVLSAGKEDRLTVQVPVQIGGSTISATFTYPKPETNLPTLFGAVAIGIILLAVIFRRWPLVWTAEEKILIAGGISPNDIDRLHASPSYSSNVNLDVFQKLRKESPDICIESAAAISCSPAKSRIFSKLYQHQYTTTDAATIALGLTEISGDAIPTPHRYLLIRSKLGISEADSFLAAQSPHTVVIDPSTGNIYADGITVSLSPAQFSLYWLLARNRLEGTAPVFVPEASVADRSEGYDKELGLRLLECYEDIPGAKDKTQQQWRTQGINQTSLTQLYSKSNKAIEDALGSQLYAEPFLIRSIKDGKRTRYELDSNLKISRDNESKPFRSS